MKIRAFRPGDISDICDMAARFYATTHYADILPLSIEATTGIVRMLHETGVLLLAEDADGATVGMVGLIVTTFAFNPTASAAYEVVWYVNPGDQSAGVGRALLAAVEPACRAAGCALIQMMHLHNSPAHAGAAYERMGYTPSEHSYTKAL